MLQFIQVLVIIKIHVVVNTSWFVCLDNSICSESNVDEDLDKKEDYEEWKRRILDSLDDA